MQRSACHPRSVIWAAAIAIPALIFAALNPGGIAGSEKSTRKTYGEHLAGYEPCKHYGDHRYRGRTDIIGHDSLSPTSDLEHHFPANNALEPR